MAFNKGDYVAGIETIGAIGCEVTREMRGWVGDVHSDYIEIQADDNYGGNRGTHLAIDTVYRCNRVEDWAEANRREIEVGKVVRHFKNKLYKVLGYASHVDGGRVVIYMALYGEYKTYVREYSEFMSKVDRNKYPNVEQLYRFEVVS